MNARLSPTSEWPVVKLGEVAELCLGKMLDAQKNKGRLQPYLRNPNVRWFELDLEDVRLMPFEEHEDQRFGLENGDVLVCEGGEAGRAAIWDGRVPGMKFQKAIHRVRCGPRLHNRFLVHRLMTDYLSGRLADYFTGATIKHLTGQDLARYRFPLPPVSEQRRIADILDKADALRAKRRAAIAQLDTLTQSIFLDMFGDPATNPKGWPMCAVGEYVKKFQGGKSFEAEADDVVETRNRVLKVSAATSMCYLPEESKPVPDSYQPPAEHFVKGGDLLFSRANTTELVGAVAFVDRTPPNILLPDKLWRFVWRMPVEPLFVWSLFQMPAVRYEIGRRATGTSGSMKNISQEKLLGILTILPPIDTQRQFVHKAEAVRKLLRKSREALRHTEDLFSAVQRRAFAAP